MKEKLTILEQVNHMKSKGVTFNIMTEEDAASYLENNTYYFKIKSYAKNYAKYQYGDSVGNYVNLEFAYLKDLSIIDMHLRHFILKTAANIEHAMKVRFLRDFNNSTDDGYTLVRIFFREHPGLEEEICAKKGNSYTSDLIDKLQHEGFAIWNIVELLSLKDFLQLYNRFFEEYPDALSGHNWYYPMQGVRKLRNAAAHNNCIINSLRKPYTGKIRYNNKIDRFITQVPGIGKKSRSNNRSNQVIYDFITMLYLVDEIIASNEMKKAIFSEAYALFHSRMTKHAEYYSKESSITSAYSYVKKIVDFLYEKAYNSGDI